MKPLPEAAWHLLRPEDALRKLSVTPQRGLSAGEARDRLDHRGPNDIPAARRRPVWRMVLAQFSDFMILVLIAAAVISGVVGEARDAAAIVVILTLNAIIGAVQEYRAERAVAALRTMAAPHAQVRRDGAARAMPARDLVPGDIVLLAAGEGVPADLRLLEAAELRADESALTGESQPVSKTVEALPEGDYPVGDRHNMAYRGTLIVNGRGTGVVTGTGMGTEIGRIAALLGAAQAGQTPLQKRLARFGLRLAIAVLVLCTVIFATGLLRGEPVVLMFLTAVSLAVAAIPEALPAVVTVSLALGARKMSRHNALVRRLPAVETLGSVTYICTDKTGTLTENRMRLERIAVAGEVRSEIPGPGTGSDLWERLGQAMALSNDVSEDESGALSGDPTEVALYDSARRAGYRRRSLESTLPRIGEVPFEAARQRMTTVHRDGDGLVAFTKGSPEKVIPRCHYVLGERGPQPLDGRAWLERAESLAAEGYRVLALAYRCATRDLEPEDIEKDLTLLGLAALIDPPRPEVPQAVADCLSAGITPVMITGDHPATALAIARRLDIASSEARAMTGADISRADPEAFAREVQSIRVFARVSPEQKIDIVEALQQRGEFVAMTGDGVNDAPALKRADIGVAMGEKGTDVARQAADMVLLDDNFATIVSAVREGRRIFDNIRKFVKYTMTSNAGEIWTLFLAPFFGLPIPLLPIQILWVNLVTDGLPGLALAAEPQEKGVMRRPPRPPEETVFAHGIWQHILWAGALIGGLSILSQAWAYHAGSAHWQTVVFTVLTLSQLAHAMAVRSDTESLLSRGLGSNLPLLGAVLLTLGVQLAVIYLPIAQPIFHTTPLSLPELAVCLLLPLVVLGAVEVEKWLARQGAIYDLVTR